MLYELAHREDLAAKEIGTELGLDAGYLSRIVQNFDENGLITRKPLPSDRRQFRLSLTAKGRAGVRQTRAQFAGRRRGDAGGAVARRPAESSIGAMADDRTAARQTPRRGPPAILRAAIAPATWAGWCRATARSMPANTASTPRSRRWSPRSPQNSSTSFDASRERCWIAEIDGAPVGSVFLVRHTDDVAKLRLLLVDPAGARPGLGPARWSTNASASRGSAAIAGSRCGPRAFWSPRAGSIRTPASSWSATEPHRSFGVRPDRRDLGDETRRFALVIRRPQRALAPSAAADARPAAA